jgi:hypothetical protein
VGAVLLGINIAGNTTEFGKSESALFKRNGAVFKAALFDISSFYRYISVATNCNVCKLRYLATRVYLPTSAEIFHALHS